MYFSFSILLTEIFNLEYLHFPFRLLPEVSNLPEPIAVLILYIINNLNDISFSKLELEYSNLSKLRPIKTDLCIFAEFKFINKYLFSYYHHNQDIILKNYQNKNHLDRYIKNHEKLSKLNDNLLDKCNYYESSYHHFNRIISELKKKNVYYESSYHHFNQLITELKDKNNDLLFQNQIKKNELNTFKIQFYTFRLRIYCVVLTFLIFILILIYYLFK